MIPSQALTALSVVFTCCAINRVFSHGDGADVSVCNTKDMKPNHQNDAGYTINNSSAEFVIELSASEYDPTEPGKSISVRLRHLDPNVKFKGYLIQARKYDSFNYIAQGRMKGPNTSFRPICGTTGPDYQNGGTHTTDFSNTLRGEASLSWSPPEDVCEALKMGDLQFQATTVYHIARAPYINIYSPVMTMKKDTDPAIIEKCTQKANNFSPDPKQGTLSLLASLTVIIMLIL